jgi:hypothetical protein
MRCLDEIDNSLTCEDEVMESLIKACQILLS